MAARASTGYRIEDAAAVRDEWVAAVERLAADVERWSAAREMFVKREVKAIDEDEIGRYELPVLTIQATRGRAHFNPVARFTLGADGRIDVYAVPSFAQLVLLRHGSEWRFLTEDLVDLGKPWSEQTFDEVVYDLLSRA